MLRAPAGFRTTDRVCLFMCFGSLWLPNNWTELIGCVCAQVRGSWLNCLHLQRLNLSNLQYFLRASGPSGFRTTDRVCRFTCFGPLWLQNNWTELYWIDKVCKYYPRVFYWLYLQRINLPNWPSIYVLRAPSGFRTTELNWTDVVCKHDPRLFYLLHMQRLNLSNLKSVYALRPPHASEQLNWI